MGFIPRFSTKIKPIEIFRLPELLAKGVIGGTQAAIQGTEKFVVEGFEFNFNPNRPFGSLGDWLAGNKETNPTPSQSLPGNSRILGLFQGGKNVTPLTLKDVLTDPFGIILGVTLFGFLILFLVLRR